MFNTIVHPVGVHSKNRGGQKNWSNHLNQKQHRSAGHADVQDNMERATQRAALALQIQREMAIAVERSVLVQQQKSTISFLGLQPGKGKPLILQVYQAKARSVYLPVLGAGEQWVHFYSREALAAGTRHTVATTNLTEFPLFERVANIM